MALRQRARRRERRGVSTLTLIVSFSLIVALLGLSIDIGLLIARHQQLKTASESAALAAALEQFANGRSRGDTGDGSNQARRQAARFAAANPIGDRTLDLKLNERNDPRGDIVFGRCDPPSLGVEFKAAGDGERGSGVGVRDVGQGDEDRINAVLVRTRHSQVGDRPVLLMGRMLGLCGPDLAAESIAAVDWRVCGFRPVGCSRVPMLPIVVRCNELFDFRDDEDEDDDDQGDDDEHGEHGRGHGRDHFACDPKTGRIERGSDGIPELVLLITDPEEDHGQGNGNGNGNENGNGNGNENGNGNGPPGDDGNGQPKRKHFFARVLNFSNNEHADEEHGHGHEQGQGHDHHDHDGDEDSAGGLTDQVLRGLTSEHLQPYAGELQCGTAVPTLGGSQNLATLAQALRAIQGQPRVLALGRWHGQGQGQGGGFAEVEDFAACVVIDSHASGKSLTIRVQPAVLHSCTAITEVGIRPNPGIGKIVLIR